MGQSISNLPGPLMQSLSGGHQIVLCCSLWTSVTQRVAKLLEGFRKSFQEGLGLIRSRGQDRGVRRGVPSKC